MPATGKIVGEGIRDYHATDAVSSSKLKVFAKSRTLYYRQYIAKTYHAKQEDSAAMDLGSLLGCLLEGGGAVERDFAINRDFADWRTNKAKEWRDQAEASGKRVISMETLRTGLRMQQAVLAHPDAATLMVQNGEPEVTFRLALKNFVVQARPDRWHEEPVDLSIGRTAGPVIAELKTTASLSEMAFTNFQKQFWDYGYYQQAALYREVVATVLGLETLPELFYVVAENAEPFRCAVFAPDPEALNLARAEIKTMLLQMRDCYESGDWSEPQFGGIQQIGLPRWFAKLHVAALEKNQRLLLT